MNPTDLLQQLHDIQTPPEPDWWPPAIGWWLLALLTLILLGWLTFTLWKGWRRWRWRQRQSKQLHALCTNCPAPQLASEVSVLLRRLALTHFPPEQVAGLHGEDWLRFLDSSAATDQFSRGPGRALLTAPYQNPDSTQTDWPQTLPQLAERWIKRNL